MAKKQVKQKQNVDETTRQSFSGWKIVLIVLGIVFVIGLLFVIIAVAGIVSFAFSGSSTTQTHTSTFSSNPHVALVYIDGVILTESDNSLFSSSSGTSSTEFVELLDEIEEDDTIKGVIFEINSPGGSGVASDEIAQKIRALDKPTVSYIREVGASGSYWIASSTDVILANKMSIVGSIGVIASYLDFSGLLEEYNVTYQRFVAGGNKDFGSPYLSPTEAQEKYFQAMLDEYHELFIEDVAKGRKMSVEDVSVLADGSIYTASQAIDNGLIDAIGGREEAKKQMAYMLNTTDISLVEYGYTLTFLDMLLGAVSQQSYALGLGIGDGMEVSMPSVSQAVVYT